MKASAGRILAGCAIAAVALSGPAFGFQNEGTVRVGMLESQTGTYAPYGLANMWGTQIAFDEINAAGGVTVGGQKVKIAVTPSPNGHDAGVDPAQSITLLRRAITEDQVLLVKGISNSNAGIAVYNYLGELEKSGDPVVVHSSSVGTPEITKLSQYAFRNSFIETKVIVNLSKDVKERMDVKTAAFFLVKDNPYYAAITEKAVIPALKELGVEVVAVAEAVTSDRNFTQQANAMRAANPDVIYVMAPTLSAINFMKEASRRQVKPKLYIGNVSLMTTETLESGGAAVEGLVMAAGYDPDSEQIASFAAEYKKRHGQDVNMFSVTGYEAGYLIAHAIENSGIANTPETLKEDRKKFRDALAATRIDSPTGETVSFSEDRETPKDGVYITIKDGKFVRWEGSAGN